MLLVSVTLYLIPCQNLEGGHDLVGSVCVGRLAGHKVDEGLEGDEAHPVGIHYAHDAGEFVLTLMTTERVCEARLPRRQSPRQQTENTVVHQCVLHM